MGNEEFAKSVAEKEKFAQDEIRSNYAKLLNPKWKDYCPDLPAGDPEVDATLLDMLEQFAVEGTITLKRTFLPGYNAWQISVLVQDAKVYASGGGASVRDALAAAAVGIAERALK